MTRDEFASWLGRYIEAWRSNDPVAIGDLFSEDAVYSYHGGSDRTEGRDAIVAGWLEEPDPPGSWEAHYEPLAIEGGTFVAKGESRYFDPDGSVRDDYSNVFVCTFDADGRCRSFAEWFVRTGPGKASPA
jgi:hypothetical protein